jgi:hypothetical protein
MSLASNQDAWINRDLEWPGLSEASGRTCRRAAYEAGALAGHRAGLRFQVDF